MTIVRVEPVVETINLTWMLGARCNYDCMYCPAELHNNTGHAPDLEQLKTAWQNFYNKISHRQLPIKINFTGGEVTANRSFLPFVEWLGDFDISQIVVTTNGSASKNYYLKLCGLIDSLSFSLHSEFVDEQAFFDTVLACHAIMIRPKKSVHVNIMDEFWNRERIPLYQQWCAQHQVSCSVNEIDYSRQTRTQPIMQGRLNLVAQC